MRDYKLEPQIWGGVADCEHNWGDIQAKPGSVYRQHLAADFCHREDKHAIAEAINSSDGGQFCCCGAWRGSLGLEPTIDLYVKHLVQVFGAVRRVLRDDGTLWVNLGDSYAGTTMNPQSNGVGSRANRDTARTGAPHQPVEPGLKPLDLCNVPHRVASALQADGWYWRSTIIWAKGLSFCAEYAGSVMPESVNGWRWEKCRVKVAPQDDGRYPADRGGGTIGEWNREQLADARFTPCPGCDKCKSNGGLVLRKGSWRPTSAYEFVFMFAKTADYYCDGEAVREALGDWSKKAMVSDWSRKTMNGPRGDGTINVGGGYGEAINPAGRNLRNVWVSPPDGTPLATDVLVVNPQAFSAAHFATFPEKLVEPIIKAATSDKGVCPECGAPWARVIESTVSFESGSGKAGNQPIGKHDGQVQTVSGDYDIRMGPVKQSTTLGWRPTCGCPGEGMCIAWGDEQGHIQTMARPIPATVLDPFVGSGTTLLVANQHGRDAIGIELSPKYARMAEDRIGKGLRPLSYRPQCNDDEDAPLFTRAIP